MSTSNDTPEVITIQLTQGQVTIISPEDADLANLKWYAALSPKYRNGGSYFAQRKENSKTRTIHRVILTRMLGRPLTSKEQVDHINQNTLDNRRENLRLATCSQNCANTKRKKGNQTGFKGVTYFKHVRKFAARICVNNKTIHIGLFNTAEEAFEAYRKVALKLQGEFARFE